MKTYFTLLRKKDMGNTAKLIYSIMLNRVEIDKKINNPKQMSYSSAELSDNLGCDEKTIRNGLKELEDNGYIQIIKEKGKKNKFSLVREKYNEIVNT